jgi:hypothetical protein
MAESERDILSEILGFDPETSQHIEHNQTIFREHRLRYVPPEGNPAPRYPSGEKLMDISSPWKWYLDNPDVLATLAIRQGKRISKRRRKESRNITTRRERFRDYLRNSEELVTENYLTNNALTPWHEFRIKSVSSIPRRASLTLGEILGAFHPDIQDALTIANNSPWGSGGGFQTVSNVVEKPIFVKRFDNLGVWYRPQKAV